MGFEATRSSVEKAFKAGWGQRSIIAYDNVPFEVPETDSWVRLSTQFAGTVQASMGVLKTWRTDGLTFVQCFVPKDTGSSAALVMADAVKTIFQGAVVDGITFRGATIVLNGQDKEWWVVNVNIPFFYDEEL